jgi:hypothetical protein
MIWWSSFGRPWRVPFARAFAMPARTRSEMSARSNSAIAEIMVNMALPIGDEVSICSVIEIKSTPRWRNSHIPSDLVVDRGASTVRGACPVIFGVHPLPSYATCQKIISTISVT